MNEECWSEERETITLIFQGERGKPIFSSPIFPLSALIINSAATGICNLLLPTEESGPATAQRPKNRRPETQPNLVRQWSNRCCKWIIPKRKYATFMGDRIQLCDRDVGQFGSLIMMRPHSSFPSFSLHSAGRSPNRIGRNYDVNSSSSAAVDDDDCSLCLPFSCQHQIALRNQDWPLGLLASYCCRSLYSLKSTQRLRVSGEAKVRLCDIIVVTSSTTQFPLTLYIRAGIQRECNCN